MENTTHLFFSYPSCIQDFGLFISRCEVPCYGRSLCLGAKVFKARNKRGFFGVMTLGVHKRMPVSSLYPDFPVGSGNLCVSVCLTITFFCKFCTNFLEPPEGLWPSDFELSLDTKRTWWWASIQNKTTYSVRWKWWSSGFAPTQDSTTESQGAASAYSNPV